MTYSHADISIGMNVSGSDGNVVGRIKQIAETGFVVERAGGAEVCLPFEAIAHTTDYGIELNAPADQIDQLAGPQPPGTAAA